MTTYTHRTHAGARRLMALACGAAVALAVGIGVGIGTWRVGLQGHGSKISARIQVQTRAQQHGGLASSLPAAGARSSGRLDARETLLLVASPEQADQLRQVVAWQVGELPASELILSVGPETSAADV